MAYLFSENTSIMQIKRLIRVSLGLAILLLFGGWLMHKFYVSLTEIRYNSETERMEISMRIFPDDLDQALLVRTGIHSRLATELEPAEADSLLKVYLLESFSVQVNGEDIELHYLGKEPESDAIWCYLESEAVSSPETISVSSSLLTEFFKDQVNIIQVYIGTWNRGLMLNREHVSGALAIEN